MHTMLDATLLVLNVTNVLLHGVGSYLLLCLYKKGKRSPQKMFIINLSVCELIMNLMECIRRVIELIALSGGLPRSVVKFQHYLLIVMFTGVSFVFYMDMIYITLDRLLNIILDFKYRVYCNDMKAKCLLIATWTIGLCICVSVSIAHFVVHFVWESVFFKYFYPIVSIAFIILALVTYTVIFRQYHKSLKIPSTIKRNIDNTESAIQVFRMSRFFVSILLITSFIIFMLIPDLVYLFYGILGNNVSDTLLASCWVSYAISNLLDGWIYIFMQSSVKALLKKKLHEICRCHRYVCELQDTLRLSLLSRHWQKDKVYARKERYNKKEVDTDCAQYGSLGMTDELCITVETKLFVKYTKRDCSVDVKDGKEKNIEIVLPSEKWK